ncbi:uncharacterized protein LOC110401214 [Numida meleagris]|uniref:uncharacterized protein LOC110401214 n=1 Tax=Numida meleagris TaxID=8996 RepID=UPI000B3D8DFC|nr:uncharacterized protein LOC110401214 [Numida meleagris]
MSPLPNTEGSSPTPPTRAVLSCRESRKRPSPGPAPAAPTTQRAPAPPEAAATHEGVRPELLVGGSRSGCRSSVRSWPLSQKNFGILFNVLRSSFGFGLRRELSRLSQGCGGASRRPEAASARQSLGPISVRGAGTGPPPPELGESERGPGAVSAPEEGFAEASAPPADSGGSERDGTVCILPFSSPLGATPGARSRSHGRDAAGRLAGPARCCGWPRRPENRRSGEAAESLFPREKRQVLSRARGRMENERGGGLGGEGGGHLWGACSGP